MEGGLGERKGNEKKEFGGQINLRAVYDGQCGMCNVQ